MNQIIRKTDECVWVIKPIDKKTSLSESETKIIESGFPDSWIAIYEDAYGKLKSERLTSEKVLKRYGFLPE